MFLLPSFKLSGISGKYPLILLLKYPNSCDCVHFFPFLKLYHLYFHWFIFYCISSFNSCLNLPSCCLISSVHFDYFYEISYLISSYIFWLFHICVCGWATLTYFSLVLSKYQWYLLWSFHYFKDNSYCLLILSTMAHACMSFKV